MFGTGTGSGRQSAPIMKECPLMVNVREAERPERPDGGAPPQPSEPSTDTERARARPRASELVTEQGKTTIADGVVAKIAGIAAREVAGVHELTAQGAGGLISGLAARVTGSDAQSQGVSVEVGEREAAVDLGMTAAYGVSIPQVAEAVRRNIMTRIEAMTGLVVKEVNINVTDLFFPEDATRAQAERRVE
jgi:uncharacterized alkaline shock family protein YloU